MEGMEGVEFSEQPQAVGGEGVIQFDVNGLEIDVNQANQAPIQPVADAPAQRLTSRFLSKYERARLLGVRSKQISMGAPPLVDPQGEYDSYQIALKELKVFRIPIIIRRTLPDGSHEDWRINEMTVL